MQLTCDTGRLRLFLENDQAYQKIETTLREIQRNETDYHKEFSLWVGWHAVRKENAQRIHCIVERGGLLHVGANFDWKQ